MKITVRKTELADAVKIASLGLSSKSPMMVLRQLMIKPVENGVTITGTDLGAQFTGVVAEAEITGDSQPFLIDGAKFSGLVSRLNGETVTIDYNKVVVISTGRSDRHRLPASPDEGFPEMEGKPKRASAVGVDAKKLAAAFRLAIVCQPEGDSLRHINGTGIQFAEGLITIYATDRHRVCRIDVPADVTIHGSNHYGVMEVIPAKTAKGVLAFLGVVDGTVSVNLQEGVTEIISGGGDRVMISNLQDPPLDYQKFLIPYEQEYRINKEQFFSALDRMGSALGSKTIYVEMESANGGLYLSAWSSDAGASSQEFLESPEFNGFGLTMVDSLYMRQIKPFIAGENLVIKRCVQSQVKFNGAKADGFCIRMGSESGDEGIYMISNARAESSKPDDLVVQQKV